MSEPIVKRRDDGSLELIVPEGCPDRVEVSLPLLRELVAAQSIVSQLTEQVVRQLLDELGLDLVHLQGLSPARQCAEILDAVLGEGSHPDELALRKASLEALKQVLTTDDAPDEATSLRSFVVSYVFELSLVELQKQVNEGAVSPADVADKERTIRKYLEARVQTLALPAGTVVQPSDLRKLATKLTKEAIRLLRAGGGGAP